MSDDGAFQSNSDQYEDMRSDDEDVLVKRERQRQEQLSMTEYSSPERERQQAEALASYEYETMLRAAALDATVKSGAFESFEDLMARANELYAWLGGEVAGGPETAQEEGTLPDLP